MSGQDQTTANKPTEPRLCKMGCGFFVSISWPLSDPPPSRRRLVRFRNFSYDLTHLLGATWSVCVTASGALDLRSVPIEKTFSRVDADHVPLRTGERSAVDPSPLAAAIMVERSRDFG
jgi:hypothetical protein